MANNRIIASRARARREAAKRLRWIVIAGSAGVVLIAVLVAIILSRSGRPDRAVEAAVRPEVTAAVAEGAPLVAEGEPLVPQVTPSPTPAPRGDTVSYASLRAATRPTPTAPGYGLVFSKADTEEKIIAITVDDCFQAENLQEIVDAAIAVGGKLTIFPIGKNALKKKQAATLKYAWEHGFELENHTFSHNGLYKISDEQMTEEVYKQQLALSYILGVDYQCHFLRPMGGDARRDQRMQVYAEQLGYYGIAHWSCAGSTSTMKEIAKALEPGAIYLFHTATKNDRDKLIQFIPWAVEQGYQLVTLNEMFGYPENETSPMTVPIEEHTIPALEPYARYYDVYKPTRYSWGIYLLQEKLIELGYMTGEPDGIYGSECAECVKAYQRDQGLEETGVADAELQERIFGLPNGSMSTEFS